MKNILLKTTTLSILTSSLLMASGWRIPESSSKSVALSGAYVANANGADTTYYNPANMSFNENALQVEIGLMLAKLEKIKYVDNNDASRNGDSIAENTLIPSIFITSKPYFEGKVRYGFSITVPGGLTKRWDDAYQKTYAEKFSLKIIEFNPTVSYMVSPKLSLGLGLRTIYSEGVVQSDGTDDGKAAIRDMTGSTIEYGYNLALAYKPNNKSNISLTYRSNVDLNEEGNAKLYLSGNKVYDGGASVTVPLPAVLAIAYAYKINDKTTIELEFDRTYWSTYKNLDFDYKSEIPQALKSAFDDPKARNWKDTNAFRIGLTHKYNDDLTFMVGYSDDGSPIPESSVSFESPDYNSNTYSLGLDYNINEKSSLGFGYLYSVKDNRKVTNTSDDLTYLDGELSNMKAHLISVAYRKTF
jgi:long-chain fatty acid transport protein